MAQLPVASHLTHAEIDRRYRTCVDPAEKTRWHLLWLVSRPENPLSATAAARLVGFTPAWGRASSSGTTPAGRTPWPTAGGGTGRPPS